MLASTGSKAVHCQHKEGNALVNQLLEPFSEENTKLMLTVAESEIGQQLQRQFRYERYCFIPEGVTHFELPPARQAELSHEWTQIVLDSDADNLQHHPFTATVGQWACREDGVDEATTDRVVRALLVHDVKEVRFSIEDEGDLTYDEAHANGAEGFHREHRDLADVLIEKGFVTEEQAHQIAADMNEGKQSAPESVPGQYIEIAERIGYIHSGTTAATYAKKMLHGLTESLSLRIYASSLDGRELLRQ